MANSSKTHDFRWSDCYRMMKNGLGLPRYRDAFHVQMAGSRTGGKIPVKQGLFTEALAPNDYLDIVDYICFCLCLDLMDTFVTFAPTYYLYSGGLMTAYAKLNAKDKVKYEDAVGVNSARMLQGLYDAFSAISQAGLLGISK